MLSLKFSSHLFTVVPITVSPLDLHWKSPVEYSQVAPQHVKLQSGLLDQNLLRDFRKGALLHILTETVKGI